MMKRLGILLLAAFLLISCAVPTCEEQEARLRVLLPETEVDLRGIPAEVAEGIVQGVILVKASYPYAFKSLSRICEKPRFDLLYANTYLKTHYTSNSIAFNGRRMQSTKSVEAQWARDTWRGYHIAVPCAAATAITVHELGHCLVVNWRLQDNEDVIRLYQRYKDAAADGKALSRSAAINIHEFVSEAIVDIVCNGKEMGPVAWRLKLMLEAL